MKSGLAKHPAVILTNSATREMPGLVEADKHRDDDKTSVATSPMQERFGAFYFSETLGSMNFPSIFSITSKLDAPLSPHFSFGQVNSIS